MLGVIMLSVIILNVVAPLIYLLIFDIYAIFVLMITLKQSTL
jgi:hypothetical protein